MGFFSNLIKKVGKFVASIFRDVEKPVKEAEDIVSKAFREFQEFIEAPIEKIEEVIEEEPEEVEEEIIRKIVKTTGYSFGRKDTLYALTYENNYINRFNELRDKILDEFSDSHGIQEKFGYDSEYATYTEFEYPEIEVGAE
jgi:ribosome biogenesis GTPase A